MKNNGTPFLVKKFINLLMVDGKKNCAYSIFSRTAHQFLWSIKSANARVLPDTPGVKEVINGRFLQCLQIAVGNVQPSLECKKCRIAGTSRLIPSIVPERRGCTLAIRWIVESARKRKKKSNLPFDFCLAQELIDAYQKQGAARQRRDQYHKAAEGNRGYLRYRWW